MTSLLFATAEIATETSADIDWFDLIVGLLGGLALFLLGMDRMTESLRVVAGDRLRRILEKLTSHRITGLLTGAGVTAVVQSSSVTTVLVVGFISAGLGACTSMTVRMYARRKGWPLEHIQVDVTHDKVHAQDAGAREEQKIDTFRREIRLDGPLDDEQRARLLEPPFRDLVVGHHRHALAEEPGDEAQEVKTDDRLDSEGELRGLRHGTISWAISR